MKPGVRLNEKPAVIHTYVQERFHCGYFMRGKACCILVLAGLMCTTPLLVAASSPNQISTLEIPLAGDTIPQTLNFPLYEQQGVRYFSAGMGKEERSLTYPPYSVKLIFVKGERAFLAGVSLEIVKHDGSHLLSIPSDEVQGPWLFLNLPTGKYVLKATSSDGTILERRITVQDKTTTLTHFRWP